MKRSAVATGTLIFLALAGLPSVSFSHGDILAPGGKTIAGPGNVTVEKGKATVVLESKTPIVSSCITVLNMTMFPVTIWLNDSPTDYVIGNGTSAYCWGKGTKKISLHLSDSKQSEKAQVLWRIDTQ